MWLHHWQDEVCVRERHGPERTLMRNIRWALENDPEPGKAVQMWLLSLFESFKNNPSNSTGSQLDG